MLQTVLLATGIVLVVNGSSFLTGCRPPGTMVLNLLLGCVDLGFAAFYVATGDYYGASKLALFGLTYAWYALNLLTNATDNRKLGWYCLLVALLAVPISFDTFAAQDTWFGVFWLLWSGLWLLFFLIMALEVETISRFAGGYTLAVSLVTCLAPGSLIAAGAWKV